MATNNQFQVFVRMEYRHGYAMHRTFTIQLNANSCIRDIAKKVAKKVDARSDGILLQFGQKPLRHDLMMCDYNIQPNSTLIASLRQGIVYVPPLPANSPDSMQIIKEKKDNSSKQNLNESRSAPKTVWNEESINKELLDLDKEYEARISVAKTLSSLKTIMSEINPDYSHQRKALMSEKMNVLRSMCSSDSAKKSDLQKEMDSITMERKNLGLKIGERDEEIRRHQEIIEQLEIEKTIFLENDIKSEKKYKKKKKKFEKIASKIVANEAKISNTKQELQKLNLNQYDTLSKSFGNALEKLENKYAEWTTEEVIAWLQLIETGKFCDRKFLGMIKEIEKLEINGKSFKDLRNDCLLRMIGGNALSLTDRQLIIKNIDRVVNGGNGKQKSNCMICVAARIDSVFLPCGHQSMCFDCYQKSKNRFRQCPICRNDVTNVVKTYLNGF